MKHPKKIKEIAALALSVILLGSCGGQNTAETTASQTAAETPVGQSTAGQNEASAPENSNCLSNPVAVDENGDVDMTVALAYETDFDALLRSLDEKTVAEGDTVSDNTNEKTMKVFNWLRENYGKNIISGQQMGSRHQVEDIAYYLAGEDLPAIKGFDFIFATTNMSNPSEWTDMAIDWHNNSNGLVAFCWHWNVPCDIDKYPDSVSKAFYSDRTDYSSTTSFSLKNAVTPGTKEYELVVHDIDFIAIELQKLEAAGVPVLWRPLHEASGGWFWWGVADKDTATGEYYQKLWYMIYDRLENYHKLTNLIWIWNGQNNHTLVHPNTYDISGIDVYPDENSNDHSEQEKSYEKLKGLTADGKMLTLSEVGFIPDPDAVFDNENVNWLYYMPWNGEFVYKGEDIYGIPKLNTQRMSKEFLTKVMTSDRVITWSELPDWGGTNRELPQSIKANMLSINQELEKGE